MTTRNRIEFVSADFYFSHGRTPRGYGAWAFEIVNGALPAVPVFSPSSTFADARRACVARLREACAAFGLSGASIVVSVCP